MDKKTEVLINENDIKKAVKDIAKKISEDYAGEEIIVVALLKGSVIFMSDLIREIKVPLKIDFMTISSYGNEKTSSREVKIIQELSENIMGKNVIIVEDIIDSGLTLKKVMEILKTREPKSLKLAVFLNKPSRREVEIHIDYCGYEIPDEFVVGYGLDFAQMYRNLPYVGILKGE